VSFLAYCLACAAVVAMVECRVYVERREGVTVQYKWVAQVYVTKLFTATFSSGVIIHHHHHHHHHDAIITSSSSSTVLLTVISIARAAAIRYACAQCPVVPSGARKILQDPIRSPDNK
jgi:uncharacterized protein YjlB